LSANLTVVRPEPANSLPAERASAAATITPKNNIDTDYIIGTINVADVNIQSTYVFAPKPKGVRHAPFAARCRREVPA
jgi:hypothetical protein